MRFKYSCIGDNTKENKEHLKKVGYKENLVDSEHELLYTQKYPNGWFCNSICNTPIPNNIINCIGNPKLFQAVTAMRDDSDYMQWFTDGIDWWLCCFRDKFSDYIKINNKPAKNYHKATLAELQEHFKMEEIFDMVYVQDGNTPTYKH